MDKNNDHDIQGVENSEYFRVMCLSAWVFWAHNNLLLVYAMIFFLIGLNTFRQYLFPVCETWWLALQIQFLHPEILHSVRVIMLKSGLSLYSSLGTCFQLGVLNHAFHCSYHMVSDPHKDTQTSASHAFSFVVCVPRSNQASSF